MSQNWGALQRFIFPILLGLLLHFFTARTLAQAPSPSSYFRIRVIDDQTSRGVPWVRLRTVDGNEFWTDSAGVVAVYEPDLMGKWVHFRVESFGYSLPLDSYGVPGARFLLKPARAAVLATHRINIAQRLYRITGVDVYTDSRLLGDSVPPTHNDAAIPVVGQDGGNAVVFEGKVFWMWGDTTNANYPLGNFKSTGATSLLPGQGGLDPETGVTLTYIRQANGSVKGMANIQNSGPVWLGGIEVVPDASGHEQLISSYMKVASGLNVTERGLARFNPSTQLFDAVSSYPVTTAAYPRDFPFHCIINRKDYLYSCASLPNVRTPASFESLQNITDCEALTCLKDGSRYDGTSGQLDRDGQGNLVWKWRKGTSPLDYTQMRNLIQKGYIKSEEALFKLTDTNTGAEVQPHNGSVYWNDYRKRWISIRGQNWGLSWIGEIWYAEADSPVGPWVYAQKILTHYISADNTYTFYNPLQHPMFDRDNGRIVFLEGTCSEGWANADHPTPQYNYNQMMYKLELDDPKLFLPVPVYRCEGISPVLYRTKVNLSESQRSRSVVCFAPDRSRANTIPIYERLDTGTNSVILSASATGSRHTAFYGVSPSVIVTPGSELSLTVPFYEFTPTGGSGARLYSTELSIGGYQRASQPLCRVWPNPIKFNPYLVVN